MRTASRIIPLLALALTTALLGAQDAAPKAAPAPGTAPAAAAVPPDPKAEALKQQVSDAYAKTATYQSTTHLTIKQGQGRTWHTREADLRVAFDRPAGLVLIDNPDFAVAADGKKVRLVTEQIPDKYLEIDAPKTLDYAALLQSVPVLTNSVPPEVVLLLADDPFKRLTGVGTGALKAVDPDPADPAKRLGLELSSASGKMTLWIDPASHLVTSVVLSLANQAPAGAPAETASVTYAIQIQRHNQPVDAKVFALKVKDARPVGSLRELAGREGGGEVHPLQGQAAPPVSLSVLNGKAYNLAEDKNEVIVLDFWATWCGPCAVSLPKLQELYDWAQKEKKSVSVYAVNVDEKPADVTKFLTAHKLTLPVLLDPGAKVSTAYGVRAIPQTVVISKGQVLWVRVGFEEGMETVIKGEVNKALRTAGK